MIRKPMATFLLVLFGTVAGIQAVRHLQSGYYAPVVMTAILLGAVMWTLFSGANWWILVPVAMFSGGVVQLQYRLYFVEVATAFLLLLAIIRILTGQPIRSKYGRVPVIAWILLAYVLAFSAVNIMYMYFTRAEGLGSIVRVLAGAVWPMVFAVLILGHGRMVNGRVVLNVLFVIVIVRALTAVVSLTGLDPTIPGVPIAFPSAAFGYADLRVSGLMLMSMALAISCSARSSPGRRAAGFLGILTIPAVAFGASRVSLIKGLFTLALFVTVRKRVFLTLTLAMIAAAVVMVINTDPEMLYKLPIGARRAFTGVVLPSEFAGIRATIEGSDRWHWDLAAGGFRRWTRSPAAFFVGNMVRAPYSAWNDDLSYEEMLEKAICMGSYEAGLWSVLSVYGLIGATLAAMLMWNLANPVFREVWRNSAWTPTTALCFVALSALAEWVVFCPVSGGFPNHQIAMLAVATAALREKNERPDNISQPSGPMLRR